MLMVRKKAYLVADTCPARHQVPREQFQALGVLFYKWFDEFCIKAWKKAWLLCSSVKGQINLVNRCRYRTIYTKNGTQIDSLCGNLILSHTCKRRLVGVHGRRYRHEHFVPWKRFRGRSSEHNELERLLVRAAEGPDGLSPLRNLQQPKRCEIETLKGQVVPWPSTKLFGKANATKATAGGPRNPSALRSLCTTQQRGNCRWTTEAAAMPGTARRSSA